MERIGTFEWTIVLLGMGTTFVALIGLSLILKLFSLVSQRRAKKAAEAKGAEKNNPVSATAAAEGLSPELVAVLTAAVAASTGRKASDVRIVRASPSMPGISGLNTPVWGYANRLASSGR
jgi:glutaconyl-CoA/methylmalonyl-CoA decarboxylase subunit delta